MTTELDFYDLNKIEGHIPLDDLIAPYHAANKGLTEATNALEAKRLDVLLRTAKEMLDGKGWEIPYQYKTWKGKARLDPENEYLIEVQEYDGYCGRDSWYVTHLDLQVEYLPEDVREEFKKRVEHIDLMLADMKKASDAISGWAMFVHQRETGYIGRGMILHDE